MAPKFPKAGDLQIREQHPPFSLSADPPPYIDGIRINSPHYLTKIKLTSPGTHTFTLVVSQYEKQNTIHYTVRVRECTVRARCLDVWYRGYSQADAGLLVRVAVRAGAELLREEFDNIPHLELRHCSMSLGLVMRF